MMTIKDKLKILKLIEQSNEARIEAFKKLRTASANTKCEA